MFLCLLPSCDKGVVLVNLLQKVIMRLNELVYISSLKHFLAYSKLLHKCQLLLLLLFLL